MSERALINPTTHWTKTSLTSPRYFLRHFFLRHNILMHLIGAFRVAVFFGTWLGSVAVIPVSIAIGLYFKIFIPIYILLSYYLYRFICPAKRWPPIKSLLNFNENPYCNSQKIVFEEGVKPPLPKTKTLLCCAPHGILTLGFVFLASSPEFNNSETKWLVTELLKKLPFISDVMNWADVWDCSKKRMMDFFKAGENLGTSSTN